MGLMIPLSYCSFVPMVYDVIVMTLAYDITITMLLEREHK